MRRHNIFEGSVLIAADGDVRQVRPDDGRAVFALPQLQRFVGGHIEIVPLHGVDRYLVVNEQGKTRLNLPKNWLATLIARTHGLPATDWIAGPALLCGADELD